MVSALLRNASLPIMVLISRDMGYIIAIKRLFDSLTARTRSWPAIPSLVLPSSTRPAIVLAPTTTMGDWACAYLPFLSFCVDLCLVCPRQHRPDHPARGHVDAHDFCSGAVFPVYARRRSGLQVPNWAFFVAKYFGSGVIVATAFIHVNHCQGTSESRSHVSIASRSCLRSPHRSMSDRAYHRLLMGPGGGGGGIVLMVIMVMFFIELLMMRYGDLNEHSHGHNHSLVGPAHARGSTELASSFGADDMV